MPTEQDLARARAAVAEAEAALRSAETEVGTARRRLALAQRRGGAQLEAAERALAQAREHEAASRRTLEAARAQLDDVHRRFLEEQADAFGTPAASLPIVLLPIRLETRFQEAEGATDLLIRIYPDDLHVDTHEPELTDEEEIWGQAYWTQTWSGGKTNERERAAWTTIADRFTPERAAWIVSVLEPMNPGARPDAPLPEGVEPPEPPRFPDVPRKAAEQTRAPLVRLLPDRWTAIGHGGSGRLFTAHGKPIREPLPAGPAPDPADGPADNADPADPGMAWLENFSQALEAGMALRVRLPGGARAGLSRLLVVGLKNSLLPDAAAARLAELLDAQHYTRGLECLSRGTPTNNTTGARSGAGAPDIGHARSFDDERSGALVVAGDGSAGDRLAAALGVPPSVLAHVHDAGDRDPLLQRAMHTALWPATVGYFLDQRLRGVVTDEELRAVRRHFIEHVRGGGPLTALRFGRQPYGLLPVTSLDRWNASEGDTSTRAIDVLRRLRDAWRRALVRVPRLEGDDLDSDLVAVLRMQLISSGFSLRLVLGADVVENAAALAGIDLNRHWWSSQQALVKAPIEIPGLPAVTPQSTAVFSALTKPLAIPFARRSEYPALLAKAGHQKLRADDFPGGEARTLLDRLLRNGLLQEYALAARRLAPRTSPVMAADLPEPELVDIRTQPTVTIWRRLAGRLSGTNPELSVGAFLDSPSSTQDGAAQDLADVREALRALAAYDEATLESALRDTLDVSSCRFDAWVTSLATRRLDAVHRTTPTGIVIGGYGWLEDVRPGAARPSDGYLQGPSPDHAATAAILASGYLSHRATSPSTFAIDLSSKRVHHARQLLDGVRRGATPAGLLGYRIERRLQELELAAFIQPFRTLAPLDTDNAAGNVCHGVRLLELWRARGTNPTFRSVVSASAAEPIDRLFGEIDDAVDALSDLLLAEGVFQIGRGQAANAATSFDGILRGEMLAGAEILNTPRHGVTFLYRLVAFAHATAAESPWQTGNARARAVAEPRLNAWLGGLFGDPARVQWRIRSAGNPDPRMVRLADLGYSAMDVACMGGAELLTRASTHARQTAGGVASVDFSREADAPDEIISLQELAAFADAASQLLGKARGLTAADLALPEDNTPAVADVDEIRARADRAFATLTDALAAVRAAQRDEAPPESVVAALRAADELGLMTVDADGAMVPLQGIESQLARRSEDAQAQGEGSPVDRAVARLRSVFGGGFLAVPRFEPANGEELARAWGASEDLLGGDPHAGTTWLTRMSMVREGASRYADLSRCADAFGTGAPVLDVCQLPFREGDRWFALPFVADQNLEGRRLSIIAAGAAPATGATSLSGLLLDEWTETVPAPAETTGLAFHYDEPESRSPQAVLIAVAPDLSRTWDLDTLEAVLVETLELAKLRLVDADAMTELDHYLPAVYVATNSANEAISSPL